jgi:outer membrane protein assembly factor BamE (lipoprotein component of BamABCDE complex)/ketosteroid isomerase-like protein
LAKLRGILMIILNNTDYKVNPMRNSILFVLAVASLESGCGAKLPSVKPFKMEVQQGNVVTSKMLLQLRPGMTRSQVRYIMGTPLIVDSFRDNRWDYFYELRKQGAVVEKRRVILDFDKDSLVSVRGDVIPSAENPDIKTIAEAPQKKAEAEKEQAWTDKLKFWKAEEGAAADKAAAATAAAVAATEAKVTESKTPAPKASEPANNTSVAAEEEVVPYIPEGEYAAAPTPQEMAKGNADATAKQVTEAKAHPVSEKEMAAQIADTVEPPPVFKQESVAAPAVAAEPEAVLPPAVKAAPAASKSITAPVAAAATIAAAAVKPAETKKAAATAVKPVQQAVPAAKTAAMAAVEDDEVIPYIPEGEYVAPVVPTEQEMVKGNMAEANAPATDAEAHQVTEKGVAPKSDHAAEASPTFVAEQLPESEPEQELPPPPPVSKPIVKPVAPTAATATTLAATEDKPAQAAAKAVEPAPVATQEVPAGDAEINQAVAGWAQAWRTRNVPNYLAAYAPDFIPEGLPSRKAWEAQRKQRLSTAGNITLVLNNTQVQRDGLTATVQFEQKYAAKAYKDELNKTLELRYAPAQKRWLITRERTEAAAGAVIAATESAKNSASVASDTGAVSNDAAAVEASVDAAIQSWAQAWRSKNTSAYFAAYSPAFVPDGLPSRAAWEAQRKKRLSPQQGKISLELTDVNVSREGDAAVATFTQKYASKAFSDEMVKRLELKLDTTNNRWLIVRESAASGADVPAAKQQVTAPEGSSEHLDGVLEQIGF